MIDVVLNPIITHGCNDDQDSSYEYCKECHLEPGDWCEHYTAYIEYCDAQYERGVIVD